MDTHNIDICPIERYGYALKSVRDISRICEEEMRESNHMRDITHLYPMYHNGKALQADRLLVAFSHYQGSENWEVLSSKTSRLCIMSRHTRAHISNGKKSVALMLQHFSLVPKFIC